MSTERAAQRVSLIIATPGVRHGQGDGAEEWVFAGL